MLTAFSVKVLLLACRTSGEGPFPVLDVNEFEVCHPAQIPLMPHHTLPGQNRAAETERPGREGMLGPRMEHPPLQLQLTPCSRTRPPHSYHSTPPPAASGPALYSTTCLRLSSSMGGTSWLWLLVQQTQAGAWLPLSSLATHWEIVQSPFHAAPSGSPNHLLP